MCLYPKFIRNPKYKPNKKNNYKPPTPTDKRLLYVPIGCGQCMECRKQKSQQWRIRLQEEIKRHKYNYFVTLTFAPEELEKLCTELGQKECNAVAGKAVRRFLERYRKKYKKSITHWLITELGQNETERIHLHGLIMKDEEITDKELNELWKYGTADKGQYVNNRTINYIVKYVTKVDETHKGYLPQIFCSAGLGKTYIKRVRANGYNGRATNETITLDNGRKINLPIYYRNKIYTEEQREKLWIFKQEQQTIYVNGIPHFIGTEKGLENYYNALRVAQKLNKELGYGDDSKKWKKKEYNVTLRMLNKGKNAEKNERKFWKD